MHTHAHLPQVYKGRIDKMEKVCMRGFNAYIFYV